MLTKFNLILFLFISQYNFSQELTVEKIWKNYEFYGSSVDGFRSMQEGNYFSKITSTEKGDAITKHKSQINIVCKQGHRCLNLVSVNIIKRTLIKI